MSKLHEIIAGYWYSIDWDVEEIWRLDLPVETLPLEDLAWHLDIPVWPDRNGRGYSMTPRQVMDDPRRSPAERDRIENASLEFPLDVYLNRDRLMILDGVHRLAKAAMLGLSEVRIRRVPRGAVRVICQ